MPVWTGGSECMQISDVSRNNSPELSASPELPHLLQPSCDGPFWGEEEKGVHAGLVFSSVMEMWLCLLAFTSRKKTELSAKGGLEMKLSLVVGKVEDCHCLHAWVFRYCWGEVCLQFQTGSQVPQASVKFVMCLRMTLGCLSSGFSLSHTGIMTFWGWDPGLSASQANALQTVPQPQP